VWSLSENVLYWVDIIRHELWKYDPQNGKTETRKLESSASSVTPCDDGRLLLACKDGIAFFDWESGSREIVAQLEDAESTNGPNEGRCDPAGRFWVGTMPDDGIGNSGALYRIGSDCKPHRVLENLSVPNTLVWAPDLETMYFADSTEQTIYAFDYDIGSGEIGNRRVFATTKGCDLNRSMDLLLMRKDRFGTQNGMAVA